MLTKRFGNFTISSPAVFTGFCLAFTLLFSSVFLFTKSLRLDEAQSLWQTRHSVQGVLEIIAQDVHLPVYFLLLRAWETVFGSTLLAIRLFSFVFLAASLPLFYIVAKQAYSSTTVATTTLLLASVSPFLLWYGSEGRMYTLLLFLTLLNMFAFLQLWKSVPDKRDWIVYALTAWLGAMTHYFFIFALFAQLVFFILNRKLFSGRSLRIFAVIAAGIVIENVAWFFYRQTVGQIKADPFLPPPTSIDVFNVFSNFFVGFQNEPTNAVFLSLWPIGVFVAFALLARRQLGPPVTQYFFLAGLLPIAVAFAFSITIRPLFLSRYLIIALPALYILFARCLFQFRRQVQFAAVAAAVVAMQGALFVEALSPNIQVNEDYLQAVKYLENKAQADDIVVISAPFTRYPVEYYYTGRARLTTFPVWDRYLELSAIPAYDEATLAANLESWRTRYTDVYVLMSYDQGYEEPFRLYLDEHVERIEQKIFSPGLTLSVYRLRYL